MTIRKAKETTMNFPYQKAVLLSFLINLTMLSTQHYDHAYDSYIHLFFADHYQRSWFNTWEPKWYTGFSVTSYPPLAHQILATLGNIIGLELAYRLLTFCLMLLLPMVLYNFSRIFIDDLSARYSSLIAVFLSSLFIITYIFGQYPTLFSLLSALTAGQFIYRYLVTGGRYALSQAICCTAITVALHHFTAVFFLPFLYVTLFITSILQQAQDEERRNRVKRIFIIITSCLLIAFLVVAPFWMFLWERNMQTTIPQLSRNSVFVDSQQGDLIMSMLGGFITLIPLTLFFFIHRREQKWLKSRNNLPLLFLAIFLLILGFGGTTPLPQIVFGPVWEWLTYDRYLFWATIMWTPLIGAIMTSIRERQHNIKFQQLSYVIIMMLLLLSLIYIGYNSYTSRQQATTQIPLTPIINFLNQPTHQEWRYLTLGFGEAAMAKLNTLSKAPTIDGLYHTARSDPILTNSGIASIDLAINFDNGITILEQVLAKADEYHLRWVFNHDPRYESVLTTANFHPLQNFSSSIILWEHDEISKIESQQIQSSIIGYYWGIVPTLPLLMSFVFAGWNLRSQFLCVGESVLKKLDKCTNYIHASKN
jgi:hypothetical protein